MKIPKVICIAVAMLFVGSAFSQTTALSWRPQRLYSSASTITKFDLDFPGGTPGELVAAIQRALGKPLNAIIPDEFAKTKLPALKMKNVDVNQLFQALEEAGSKQEIVASATYSGGAAGGYTSYQQITSKYGFRRAEGGIPTDDSIWNFYVQKPNYPGQSSGKICRFYSLAGYLERGATVDEI